MKWCLLFAICIHVSYADYWQDRAQLLAQEKQLELGADIVLSEKELKVNKILMQNKLKEIDDGFLHPENYLPSQHFFHSKPLIEQSPIFEILRLLPKGASLHSHDTALVSFEYLYNLTYSDNLYACIESDELMLHFFKENETSDACDWKLVSESRQTNPNFDSFVKSKLSLIINNPEAVYTDINIVWSTFMKIFTAAGPLITYKPVFQDYFYQVLKELYEDNIMYLEFRGMLPEVYDLDGKIYTELEVTGLYVDTLNQFKHDYPDFYGAKLIYAPLRSVSNATIATYANTLSDLQKAFPDFIAGFDLVGQEDLGEPLARFIPKLLEMQSKTKFFFHAGETDWNGESTDLNLVDAVLLNTRRIGHGYAILKHPSLLPIVKKKQIALEISPISNQVLKLVSDLRNHPGSILIANGYPVVICCDDPTFWGARALTYDWYMAFMGLASRESDLKLLKQLAINSIQYSTIDDQKDAFSQWNSQWEKFLDNVLEWDYNRRYFCKQCYYEMLFNLNNFVIVKNIN